ncbi:MAG: Vgb family protein, partial [Candidatus Nitrosocosmicus sp.]
MKKSIKYSLIAVIILAISSLAYSYFNHIIYNYTSSSNNIVKKNGLSPSTTTLSSLQNNSDIEQVMEKNKQRVCGDNKEGSTYYITEYIVPISCSQPVGLVVDKDNNLWVAADWAGYLLVFNQSSNTFSKTVPLPNWHSVGLFGSMIWDMKFDNSGNLWFTDEKSNSIWKYLTKENKFERYLLPTRGGYPVSLVFDSSGRVWFTEIFGKKLGVLDPLKVQNNTTKGITELDLLKYVNFDTTGPISNSFKYLQSSTTNNKSDIHDGGNMLWLSTVNFPIGGQLVKYDITKKNLTVYDLSDKHTIPLSVAEDEKGRVWTNDHASSLFLMLDPATGFTKQYATSFPMTVNTTTLPYYNEYRDGKIWFNEHYGNAIAFFDPKNNTLVEYHIPTEDSFWGNASNPLRFVFDNNDSIWFTEWTENKIGVVHKDKINSLPISISTSKDTLTVDKSIGKGDAVDIYIYKNSSNIYNGNGSLPKPQIDNKSSNITMYATSSISKLGKLSNLTSSFSTERFSIPVNNNSTAMSFSSSNLPYKTTLKINPIKSVNPGNYTLTISARYNHDVTISKIINLNI